MPETPQSVSSDDDNGGLTPLPAAPNRSAIGDMQGGVSTEAIVASPPPQIAEATPQSVWCLNSREIPSGVEAASVSKLCNSDSMEAVSGSPVPPPLSLPTHVLPPPREMTSSTTPVKDNEMVSGTEDCRSVSSFHAEAVAASPGSAHPVSYRDGEVRSLQSGSAFDSQLMAPSHSSFWCLMEENLPLEMRAESSLSFYTVDILELESAVQ